MEGNEYREYRGGVQGWNGMSTEEGGSNELRAGGQPALVRRGKIIFFKCGGGGFWMGLPPFVE